MQLLVVAGDGGQLVLALTFVDGGNGLTESIQAAAVEKAIKRTARKSFLAMPSACCSSGGLPPQPVLNYPLSEEVVVNPLDILIGSEPPRSAKIELHAVDVPLAPHLRDVLASTVDRHRHKKSFSVLRIETVRF